MRFGGLPQDTEIAIFRIVQEAFTNVHKHSWSKDVIIRAVRSDADVRVEIEDYGKGMPLLSGPAGGNVQLGVGTAGMRERQRNLAGTLRSGACRSNQAWRFAAKRRQGGRVENVKKIKPDMVLLDLTMPDMNGLDAARQIRDIAPNKNLVEL
jgi:glucose-6-phosphate-specific signal transduction histidine kinase